MPRYEVELRQWVEFRTIEYVDAPTAKVAREEVYKHNSEWERTGLHRPATVVAVRKVFEEES